MCTCTYLHVHTYNVWTLSLTKLCVMCRPECCGSSTWQQSNSEELLYLLNSYNTWHGVVADFPILHVVSVLYLSTKNVAKIMRKISCGAKKTERKSWFMELSDNSFVALQKTNTSNAMKNPPVDILGTVPPSFDLLTLPQYRHTRRHWRLHSFTKMRSHIVGYGFCTHGLSKLTYN